MKMCLILNGYKIIVNGKKKEKLLTLDLILTLWRRNFL